MTEELGEGSFAKVYKGFNRKGKVFAVKEMKNVNTQYDKYITEEINIAKHKLKHKNIVEIHEHFTVNRNYIVMEFCEMGNLNDYMVENDTEICQRISFMCDMALGVNYLHSQNIIHRDLKPENIILTDKSGLIVCKITDFGVSRIKLSKYDKCLTYIGSYPYMAPEITGDQEYGSEVDIFALGLLFYAVFKNTILTNSFGQRYLIPGIYIERNRIAYLNELMKKEKTTEEEFLVKYYKEETPFGKFIFSMLHIEQTKRPGMESVLVQVTTVKVQNELNQIIQGQKVSINDLQTQNDGLRQELHQLHEHCKQEQLELRNQMQEMDRLISHKNDTISNIQKEVIQVVSMLERQEIVNTDLQEYHQQLKQRNEEIEKEKYMMQEELNKKEDEKKEREAQLRNLREQHVQDQSENEKLIEAFQDIISQREVTMENMRKQNDFQMKQLDTLQETQTSERENRVLEEKENQKIITGLQQECVTKQQEITDIRKAYDIKIQKQQDEAEDKDSVIKELQKNNTHLQVEVKEMNQKLVKMTKDKQDVLSQRKMEVLALRKKLIQKDQEIVSLREKEKQNKEDLQKKEVSIRKRDEKITELYKQMAEPQQMSKQEIPQQKTKPEIPQKIPKQERPQQRYKQEIPKHGTKSELQLRQIAEKKEITAVKLPSADRDLNKQVKYSTVHIFGIYFEQVLLI